MPLDAAHLPLCELWRQHSLQNSAAHGAQGEERGTKRLSFRASAGFWRASGYGKLAYSAELYIMIYFEEVLFGVVRKRKYATILVFLTLFHARK